MSKSIVSVTDDGEVVRVSAPGYNNQFRRSDGFSMRWGDTLDQDPKCAPGPELLDIEIATACHGPFGTPCGFCYKGNTGAGEIMPLGKIKAILSSLPPTVMQIAYGIGDMGDHLWPIFEATRARGIVPNVTISGAGVGAKEAAKLVELCGSVAVSRYGDGNLCFDTVSLLTSHGLKQVNIHQIVSENTIGDCEELIESAVTDPRLQNLHAIIFLMLKPHKRGTALSPLKDMPRYRRLIDRGLELGVNIGFDSCSAPSFKTAVTGRPDAVQLRKSCEACESGIFSLYMDVKGHAYPCSFSPGTPGWEQGIDVTATKDFIAEVWNHPKLLNWKKRLLTSSSACTQCPMSKECRSCLLYPIEMCNKVR